MAIPIPVLLISFIVLLVATLLTSIEIAYGLGALGVLGLYLVANGASSFDTSAIVAWTTANSFVLTAVPLFVLMSELITASGMAQGIFNFAAGLLRWLPGRELSATIGAGAFFAAVTGSSAAGAVTIGGVTLPQLEKRGFNRHLTLGVLAGSGTLGILIPPSIPLIVYGAFSQSSVGKLFAAGVIPGIIVTALFLGYVALLTKIRPDYFPKTDATSFDSWWALSKEGLPIVIVAAVVLGSIYLGVATATEAAALGATASLALGLASRKLSPAGLRSALNNTVKSTVMILWLIVGASIVAYVLTYSGSAAWLKDSVVAWGGSTWMIFALIVVMYLVLGMLMDGMSMMVMTLPMILPVVAQLGFDQIWFSIVLVILIEIGLLTPPVGINLFIIQGIANERSLVPVVRGSLPFICLLMLALGLLVVFPELATWLPSTIK